MDAGTRMLLEALEVRITDIVADVGCGYGLIGLVAAERATRGHLTLIDVDLIACECAKENLEVQGIENAEVVLGDGLDAVPGREFTLIVSNPPFHSGHEVELDVAKRFIDRAYTALKPRGRLVLVANRFLPYPQMMAERFGSVRTLSSTNQYHVLYAEKTPMRRRRG
jgi:16S rRNA (guanine1207-N2)-methyltransferase